MTDSVSNCKIASTTTSIEPTPVIAPVAVAVDPAAEKAKKVKALRKKLRDIEEIAAKKSEDLTPEQKEKLSRKAEIESEIARLSL